MSLFLDINIAHTGYVLCYHSTGDMFNKIIVDRQIKAGFTPEQANITHVEIAGIKVDGQRFSVYIGPPKAKVIDIVKKHKGRGLTILRFKNDYYERFGRCRVSWLAASKANAPYDFTGVLSFMFSWIKQNNRLWFCSEAVAQDFKTIFPQDFADVDPAKCLPAWFMADNRFEQIWTGVV